MIRVILADDHSVVRQGLRALLEEHDDLQVVAEAAGGLEAIALAEKHRPDILVIDVMMPGLNGLEAARQVTQRWPGTRVIVLSMYSAEAYVLDALRAGAAGYVLKKSTAEELVQAIRAVAEGGRFLSPPISERAIEDYIARAKGRPDPYDKLSPREREVLQLASQGLTNRQIAGQLHLSPRTVEMHRASMLRKLGLRGQTELVRFAIEHRLVSPES
jgi:DNA-binding NarL/FixJ family response regulator